MLKFALLFGVLFFLRLNTVLDAGEDINGVPSALSIIGHDNRRPSEHLIRACQLPLC